jgi:flagellar export protein FliJ
MAKYRLQALMEMRERAEEEAKQVFADAQAALREQEQVLANMEQELQDMIEDRLRRREEYSQKLASGEMKITDQSSAYRFLDRLKEKEQDQRYKIEGQKEVVRQAEMDVKRAQDQLILATQDLKALQKHKEKWEKERKKLRQAREEDQMDEIGQVIFNQNKLR